MSWDKNKHKFKFDYSIFACTIGFIGIISIILYMIIINGI